MTERAWKFRTMPAAALALAALLLLVAGCAGSGTAGEPAGGAGAETRPAQPATLDALPKNAEGYADISVDQLAGALDGEKAFTLVNVHIPYEGELPRTDLFIPYTEIRAQAGTLPDKDAPIVLYCRSGAMSTSAARDLVALGYTNVMEVDGGMVAWEAGGRELQFNR